MKLKSWESKTSIYNLNGNKKGSVNLTSINSSKQIIYKFIHIYVAYYNDVFILHYKVLIHI